VISAADQVHCTVPSHPKYLPLVRSVVQEAAALAGFESDLTQRLLLAVTEALTNVIRHAYGGAHDKPVDLEVLATPGELRLDLVDYGEFIDPKYIESRPLDKVRPGGIGVHLIKSTMDRVEYTRNAHGGTTLTMVKRAGADNAAAKKEPQ
jgi:anti-sigma regulatory factor (Ser/Thr protein kinase)